MDYDKNKVEEAFALLKELYPIMNDYTKEKIAGIIPELAESEEERIRKALLRCCDDWEKGQFGCMKAEDVPAIRAYLEKQKEQQPKQETWANLSNCIHDCKNCKGKCFYRKEEYQEHVPAEWSEEDKKMLEVISYKMSQHQGNDDRSLFTPDEVEFIDGMEDKLKSLRPQPKQEWSKEDEIMLRDVLGWIPAKSKPEFNQRRVDWLKNLPNRFALSNWKPGEAQMCALKYASTYVPDDEGTLAELYEQLKKL